MAARFALHPHCVFRVRARAAWVLCCHTVDCERLRQRRPPCTHISPHPSGVGARCSAHHRRPACSARAQLLLTLPALASAATTKPRCTLCARGQDAKKARGRRPRLTHAPTELARISRAPRTHLARTSRAPRAHLAHAIDRVPILKPAAPSSVAEPRGPERRGLSAEARPEPHPRRARAARSCPALARRSTPHGALPAAPHPHLDVASRARAATGRTPCPSARSARLR